MLLLLCCITILLHLLGLPWWTIMVIVFIASMVKPLKSGSSFGRGFLVVFISWVIICVWTSWQNEYVLPSRIAGLLSLPHWGVLVLCTGLLGGIIGGLSGLAGCWMRGIKVQ